MAGDGRTVIALTIRHKAHFRKIIMDTASFLPMTPAQLAERGISQPDFIYVSGDAYVDHPSFGMAIITRLLEKHGYSVAVIAQPDFRDPDSVTRFGEPALAFIVSAGNMDSMVNHYTVALKHRGTDAYSPGGRTGLRPDRACIVYGNLIRKTYKKTPIILGGIEASLRRLGHYDYWSDKVRRSILLDSGADLISYGMGEHSILEIAEALSSGMAVRDITYIRGTVYKTRDPFLVENALSLPSFEEIKTDKKKYAQSFGLQYRNTDPYQARTLYETYDKSLFVVQNPPSLPLTQEELDDVYDLPYANAPHPIYEAEGGIPAINEIRFSITANRGCFGGCHFCALTFHQGRIMQSRSKESILREAVAMTKQPDFKGYIHDVGGPTANFRHPSCQKQLTKGTCPNRQCLTPTPCPNLRADHRDYLDILRALRALPGVKKVFVRSGIRFDYILADKDRTFLDELCRYHISGQLRVAPEHISDPVLEKMGKPPHRVYSDFVRAFAKANKKSGRDQYLVPYLMSSHPGSTLTDAVALAEYLHQNHLHPDQVQDFYPTPGTVSTCMYHTGLDPLTLEKVFVVRNPHEKALQRALIQYSRPENHDLVREALLKAGRSDLIGFGPDALIPPRPVKGRTESEGTNSVKKGKASSWNSNSSAPSWKSSKQAALQKPPKGSSSHSPRSAHTSASSKRSSEHDWSSGTAKGSKPLSRGSRSSRKPGRS